MYTDPVNRIRTSQPQALIDTDFEYGTQPTKWENLILTNNRPFIFNGPNPITGVSGVSIPENSKIVTVTVPSGAPGIGTAIIVTDTHLNIANGNFIVKTSNGSTSFINFFDKYLCSAKMFALVILVFFDIILFVYYKYSIKQKNPLVEGSLKFKVLFIYCYNRTYLN